MTISRIDRFTYSRRREANSARRHISDVAASALNILTAETRRLQPARAGRAGRESSNFDVRQVAAISGDTSSAMDRIVSRRAAV
ncbi:hypothetical protein EVAR_45768_1 [Eumeta japonica]|uniref:Uncharacterized protein n=1 Tax=Eumeta variegata TaxID=151549 RepID=A0A4C1YYH6_EUMVA|nr:hypothetical protein EVAR_45768_1 [Eumeta japonica]